MLWGTTTDPAVRGRSGAAVVALTVGAVLQRLVIRAPHGSGSFARRAAVLQATWLIGGWLAKDPARRRPPAPIQRPLLIALAAGTVFVVGGRAVRPIRFLRERALDVLDHQTKGSTPVVTALAISTGISEEVFFRGSLFDVLEDRGAQPIVGSTAAYMAVVSAAGNPLLVFAAALLGGLCATERSVTGATRGPTVIHVVWTAVLLSLLPRVLRTPTERDHEV